MEIDLSSIEWNEILSGIATLIALIALYAIRSWLAKFYKTMLGNKNATPLDIAAANDKIVMDLISDKRSVLRADRAYVIQFHNGDFFSSRNPIWRITMTHESCEPGIAYVADQYRNVAVSIVLDRVTPFWHKDVQGVRRLDASCQTAQTGVYYFHVEKMGDGWAKTIFMSQSVVYAMSLPIYSPDGRIIGMLGFDTAHDFSFLNESGECSAELVGQLRNCANMIGYLLSSEKSENGGR